MTTTTAAGNSWVPVVASIQVAFGLAGLVAVFSSSTTAAIVVGTAALVVLATRALLRASRELDRILAEELDR